MDPTAAFQAALLGIVEGLTEFIPVSSTGHLILLVDLLGFAGPPGKSFEIVIQLGAILAVLLLYFARLWGVLVRLPTDPGARRFAGAIIAAFLPAAVLGVTLHDLITRALFNPWVVSVALILGGIAILAIERALPEAEVDAVEKIGIRRALLIGCAQALAMVPGVSRSGATIIGSLLLRLDRRTAAEFSFFLAIPTMLGATTVSLYKNWSLLSWQGSGLIAIGFACAFLVALVVVRAVIGFISRHGFAPFAWYRIGIGALMLVVLALR
ncbi:MAG: undecaprenyl-diphosphate phosphatase [Alphaproteobacteria bacterium]|nr:undecaprenyl-diphosphate phosphatase [Alphaproteobacteria bacterium]